MINSRGQKCGKGPYKGPYKEHRNNNHQGRR